jgi:hypothetical protein
MKPRRLAAGIAAVGLLWGGAGQAMRGGSQAGGAFTDWATHPAIAYASRATRDPVAELNRRLRSGEAALTFDGPSGYLRSVLAVLEVPVESQIALFLKDSLQAAKITAQSPRAIFFNDAVAVGFVRGGVIEIAAQDQEQATVFYTLEQTPVSAPTFTRRFECLACHYSYATSGVPGRLVRGAGRYVVDDRVPFDERWGGWYVTGAPGSIRHAGNVAGDRLFESPPATTALAWPSLEGKLDTAGYLSPYSDVVALLVFDHQMRMTNLLGRIGWAARTARYDSGPSEAARAARDTARDVVDELLFVDETTLPGPVVGSSGFAARFASGGPRDHRGRSLRQFDLTRRLMRYPCSYMVYSAAFDGLPAEAKDAIYRRLWEVLSGRDQDPKYARLSGEDRQAVVEILTDTKADLPDYFSDPLRF